MNGTCRKASRFPVLRLAAAGLVCAGIVVAGLTTLSCTHLSQAGPMSRSVAPSAHATAAPAPSMARPLLVESPSALRGESLPLPEAPAPVPEDPPGVSPEVPARPAAPSPGRSPLPLPVPLARAPRWRPHQELIERALSEPRRVTPAAGPRFGAGLAAGAAYPGTATPYPTQALSPAPSVAAAPRPEATGATRAPAMAGAAPAPPAAAASPPPAGPRASVLQQVQPKGKVPGERTPPQVDPAERMGAARPSVAAPQAARRAGNPPEQEPETGKVLEGRRDVLARRGDPVELSFEGAGWLFVSGSRGGGNASERKSGDPMDGLEFTGSAAEGGRSRFTFVARELGDYLLSFQFQDHRAGVLRNEVVRLRVLEEEAFLRALGAANTGSGALPPGGLPGATKAAGATKGAGTAGGTAAGAATGGVGSAAAGAATGAVGLADPGSAGGSSPLRGESPASSYAVPRSSPDRSLEQAEQLYSMGELELALGEYLRNYRSGDPSVDARIADIYSALGQPKEAAAYYQRNLEAELPYRDRAVVGMVRCALAMGDEGMIAGMISPLLNVEALPVREELLGMARHLQTAGRGSTALRLLEEYGRRYPLEPGMDEALYRMGELYESDSGLRDLAAARSAYRRVYEQWPESRFAERAYERLRYLERHFFDVR